MKNFLLIIAILIIVAISGLAWYKTQMKTALITIKGHEFNVTIADTDSEREKGLGNRESLDKNSGMLFLFPLAQKYSFWMKDMRFNLDILWINDNRIVYIAKDVPILPLKTLTPDIEADKVLEINAGLSDEYEFKIGDIVDIHRY